MYLTVLLLILLHGVKPFPTSKINGIAIVAGQRRHAHKIPQPQWLFLSTPSTNEHNSNNSNNGNNPNNINDSRKLTRAMIALGSFIGLSKHEATTFLTQYPELYLNDHDGTLMSKLVYFTTDLGINKSRLKRMIRQHPYLMRTAFLDSNDLTSSIDALQSDLSLSSDDIWTVIHCVPAVMRYPRSDIRRKLTFYRSTLGMSDEELKAFVLSQPRNLGISVNKLEGAIAMLQEELFTSASTSGDKNGMDIIRAMMLRYPSLFLCSTEKNLRPTIQFLKKSDIGTGLKLAQNYYFNNNNNDDNNNVIINDRIKSILLKCPNILSYSVEQNLLPTIQFLRNDVGCSVEQLGKIVWRLPEVLGCSVENNLRPKIDYLRLVLGLTQSEFYDDDEKEDSHYSIPQLLVRNPNICSLNLERNIIPKINYFVQECDFTTNDLRRFIVERPQTLSFSLDQNLIPKINYFLSDAAAGGLTKDELKRFIIDKPGQLAFNLELRIKPRIQLMMERTGINLKDAPVTIISRSDGSFMKWIEEHSEA